jgi:hypothetical protein
MPSARSWHRMLATRMHWGGEVSHSAPHMGKAYVANGSWADAKIVLSSETCGRRQSKFITMEDLFRECSTGVREGTYHAAAPWHRCLVLRQLYHPTKQQPPLIQHGSCPVHPRCKQQPRCSRHPRASRECLKALPAQLALPPAHARLLLHASQHACLGPCICRAVESQGTCQRPNPPPVHASTCPTPNATSSGCASVLQGTRQVARAAIEWYGPDRPKWLGELPGQTAAPIVTP